MVFIFITLLIDVTGLGIIIPVLPQLVANLTGGSLSDASKWGGLLTFTYAAVQFLFAPIIGGLSDRYGRRPVLLASLLAFSLDFVVMGLSTTIWWLFAGRLLSGITGASFTTASAYIADVSPPEKRAQNFGLIGVAFGLGFIIGPVIGGLLGQFGVRTPFFAAAALAFLNALYGYFILPESLSAENRRAFDWRRANPWGSFKKIASGPVILWLSIAFLCLSVAGHANQSMWSYITMEKFKWDSEMVGWSLGWVGLSVAVVQGGLTRLIIPKLGQRWSAYTGLMLYTVGFLLFAFATRGWMMFAFMVPFALGGIAGPALQGIMSGLVPPNEQGELQGSMTGLMSAASIIGPLLMSNIFYFFTHDQAPFYFPGVPFLVGAFLSLVSLIIVVQTLRKSVH